MKGQLRLWNILVAIILLFCALFGVMPALQAQAVPADSTYQSLPFSQDWTNTGLITANDDWSGVPGIQGFLGDDPTTTASGVDPQTILVPNSTIDVIANQTNPNTLTNGGVAEFEIADPVVALQGSGTADYPHLVFYVNTTGKTNIRVQYNVRDIDGSADNAIQPVALQYRVGESGDFTNVPAGFIADATTGPSLATLVTPVDVTLPAAADDQAQLQIRVITYNAAGSDEWVGIDDINVTGEDITGPTNPSGVGSADPNTIILGKTNPLLTVTVTSGTNPDSTGLEVTCDLTDIGGSATQSFFNDGTNGDVTAGDNIFSYAATVDGSTTPGAKSLPCTISDAEMRSGSANIGLNVLSVLPIGTVNGPVLDTDNGATHTSPYVGQTVTIQGVIYEKTLQAISGSTNTYKGFYIQNTAATADGDPNTSDGLFVFMSTYPDLIGGYVPTVGDEVVISGKVSEYYNMTELGSATLAVPVVRSGVDIDTEVAPVVADPPANLADANRYWERMQGMRVQVPMDSIVLGGRNVFNPADAEVWVASPDSTIAQRVAPYTDRAFRDAHPLDDNYDPANWDGNGYRILMGSLGIKGSLGDGQALIDPARTFDTVTNAPAGGLNYTFSKYRIEITEQPTLSEGPDPALNNPPAAVDPSLGYTIADYNLENLYDYRDNPFSGCDFSTDTGCPKVDPFLAAINPPFDYVPASDAAYQARLTDIATQIKDDLHSPDILMVQEVENQDICTVESAALVCGVTDNADGKPDVLQELALKIAELGGPSYDAAFDRDSSDLRGIVPAFLYRTDRVQLLPPSANDPVLGSAPTVIYAGDPVPNDSQVSNPKTLNAMLPAGVSACESSWVFPRAPDIALFRVFDKPIAGGGSMTPQTTGSYQDVYVINNHFKSGPDSCVDHRTEQAKYNAAIVKAIETAEPDANVVVGGDLNVYPRPDDPFAPIGQPGSSDQLGALYAPDLGLKNLWEVLLNHAPQAAYSYVYVGMAQTLDQMFMNQALLSNLYQVRIAHINSDFPADYPGDVARGTSDHDPMVATIYWASFTPTADAGGPYRVDQGGDVALSATATDPLGGPLTYAWDLNNDGVYDDATGPTVTYHAGFSAGDFPVSVKVIGANGAEKVASATVSVNNRYLLPLLSR
jgi:predicted extracellular nuclease